MTKLIRKTTIFDPARWQGRKGEFAISADWQMIAVHLRDSSGDWPKDHKTNIFVYDLTGKLLLSFTNYTTANRGITFWPDTHHILVPGEDPYGNRDGLKLWRLGAEQYSLPFESSVLSGIWVNLMGVSPSGTYIVGSVSSDCYCLNTITKEAIVVPPCRIVKFSQDERYMSSKANAGNWLTNLSDGISYSDSTTGFFLSFLPNSQQYLSMGSNLRDSSDEWHIRDIKSFEVVSRFAQNDKMWLRVATYSNHGDLVAGGNYDGNLFLFKSDDFSLLAQSIAGHPDAVTHIYFSPDDSEIISISEDSAVVWQYLP